MLKSLFILILFLPWLCYSQTNIVGRVVIYTGEPVTGVNIRCASQQTGTVTDSTGYFKLECTLPCVLEFTHINYKKETFTIKDDNTPFIIILQNKFNNLKEVVITGQSISDRIYSTRRGIEMIPAILGEQDILKYLATTPGIITTNALDAGIYVRGSNSSENSFLTNDMEIASPGHLTGILSTFDPFLLSNSTMYKSGFPSIYNGHLSSYINLRPEPGNKQKYEGELTLGLVSSAIKAKGPLIKNHTSFAASVRTSYLQTIARLYNKSVKDNSNQNTMPEYSFHDLTFNVDSRLSQRWRLSAFGLLTKDKLDMQLNENLNYNFDWNTFSGNIGGWYTSSSQDLLHIRIGVKSTFSKGDANSSIPMGGGNRHTSFLGRLTYTHRVSDQFFLNIGGKFEQSRFETANKPDPKNDILIRSSDKRFNIYELFCDFNYQLNSYFTFYAGANYQFYNGDSRISHISPRAKINFSIHRLTLWADYAQTTQYLSLYPYFTVKTPIDIWYPLEKGMQPSLCHQYSIGAEQEIIPGLSLYTGLFYKKMQHVKDFSSGISTKYTVLTDNMITGRGYAKGAEFNIAFNHPKLNARFNYTLSESKRKFREINQGKAFFPPFDVKHNVVITSSCSITSRLILNTLWTFSSGVHTTFPAGVAVAQNMTGSINYPILIPVYTDRYNYKLPNNHRLDVNLDYSIPYRYCNLKLSFGAYNVYNQSNPSFVYFKPGQTTDKQTKFIPKSKIMLPFIPYISVKLKF